MNKRLPIFIVVVLLVAGGVWFATRKLGHHDSNELRLSGNVDIREVNLGFRVSGRLAQMMRDEGDTVTNGEVIARLDDEPYRRAAEEARSQVAAARARLQLLEAGNRPQEIAQARALVHEREVSAGNANRLYQRQEQLFASKTISIQERDDAEANASAAEARLKSAREELNLLEAGFRSEDIAQAKANLAQTEAALASAELRVADTVLLAPADGVVLTRAQEPGAVVQPGATVITLSLQKPVWIRAYVSEPDLGRIHPGLKVEVNTDARPGNPYSGQVGYISPRAEFTPKNVETTELRTSLVYRFRVVVDNPDSALRQGMPVTVVAVSQTK